MGIEGLGPINTIAEAPSKQRPEAA